MRALKIRPVWTALAYPFQFRVLTERGAEAPSQRSRSLKEGRRPKKCGRDRPREARGLTAIGAIGDFWCDEPGPYLRTDHSLVGPSPSRCLGNPFPDFRITSSPTNRRGHAGLPKSWPSHTHTQTSPSFGFFFSPCALAPPPDPIRRGVGSGGGEARRPAHDSAAQMPPGRQTAGPTDASDAADGGRATAGSVALQGGGAGCTSGAPLPGCVGQWWACA